jgi:RNA polymerase sigma factor (sigma-70 family)
MISRMFTHETIAVVKWTCRRMLGNNQDAEDAASATCEKALRAIRNGNGPDLRRVKPVTFLYAIAIRTCIDRLRQLAREKRLLDEWAAVLRACPSYARPQAENMILVAELLAHPEMTDLLALIGTSASVHGMTQEEISVMLNMPRRTVGYKLDRFNRLTRERGGDGPWDDLTPPESDGGDDGEEE